MSVRGFASLLLGSTIALTAVVALGQTVLQPVPTSGPYPVACTNVEQDLTRVSSGETADMYWRGASSGGKERYVDALLVSPTNALKATITPPNDGDLYDRWAGTPVSYVYLACYPTTADNARADYALPLGAVVPKMQRGDQAPLLPASPARLPVLLYSHGYGGSPLTDSYLNALIAFASWGYVVVAPFHGDLRYSAFGPDAVARVLKAYIPIWSEFVAMQAVRPLSLSAGLDLLLSRADWRDRIDVNHVGAFGISQGGETLMLLGGAELNYGLFTFAHKRVTLDSRVRAGVGYVPYFGIESIPAFGTGQAGAGGVPLPYLALSGTADPIAPPDVVRTALDLMVGPRGQVLLTGQGHDLNPQSGADIITWSLKFLAAWVNDDAAAKSALIQADHVEGGLDDHKVLYVDPTQTNATPNYQGLWWASPADSESGWGVNIAHQDDIIFATWFTYDAAGKAWWLSLTAAKSATGAYSGTLYTTTGPPFSATPFNPALVNATAVGNATLTFSDLNNASFAYVVNGISQSKAITRQVFGPLPVCSFGTGNLAAATNYQDIWWASPPGSESGWGINFAHEGDIIFATWFTYANDGSPMWLSVTAPKTAQSVYTGTLYRTTGPPFNSVPFNPQSVVATPAGVATFTFTNGNAASFTYTLDGVTQTKAITREVFRLPGTTCQ